MESKFNSDIEQERITIEYVDKEFFNSYANNKYSCSTEIVNDIERQFLGEDIIVHYDKFPDDIIDVKAQLNSYLGNPTNTFCLELLCNKKDNSSYVDGWFVRDDLLTTHYMFMWVHKVKDGVKEKLSSTEDILDAELMIINKQMLRDYLSSIGLDKNTLRNISLDMKKNNTKHLYYDINKRKLYTDKRSGRLHIMDSSDFAESPINIIIPKHILCNIARSCYRILTSNGSSLISVKKHI